MNSGLSRRWPPASRPPRARWSASATTRRCSRPPTGAWSPALIYWSRTGISAGTGRPRARSAARPRRRTSRTSRRWVRCPPPSWSASRPPRICPWPGPRTWPAGLADECSRVGASVAGGDLSGAPLIMLAVTALGDLEGRAPVTRAGARPGDVVAVAGVLGHSAAGLALLQAGLSEPADLLAAHRWPHPDYPAGPDAARLRCHVDDRRQRRPGRRTSGTWPGRAGSASTWPPPGCPAVTFCAPLRMH